MLTLQKCREAVTSLKGLKLCEWTQNVVLLKHLRVVPYLVHNLERTTTTDLHNFLPFLS